MEYPRFFYEKREIYKLKPTIVVLSQLFAIPTYLRRWTTKNLSF